MNGVLTLLLFLFVCVYQSTAGLLDSGGGGSGVAGGSSGGVGVVLGLMSQYAQQQQLSSPAPLQYSSFQQSNTFLKGSLFSPSSSSASSCTAVPTSVSSSSYSPPFTKSLPQPISRPERVGSASSEGFQRAPGAEVKSRSLEEDSQIQVCVCVCACVCVCMCVCA